MVYLLIDSAERFRGSVRAALCCLTVVSLYAIKQWVAYHNLFADFRGWGGLSGDPNYYAAVVVLWSPVAMITKQPSSLLGWLFRFACGLAIFFAFATAGSRGGLAGLVASGVFLLITHRQVKHTLGALATLTVLVPMLLIMPNSPLRRLTDPTISDQSAVTNRTLFWRAATGTFLDNPIIGVGDQRFAEELWERQKAGRGEHFAHNTYLEMLGRYGLAGGIPFVWLLVAVFSSLGRAARRLGDKELANAARAMQAGVVGYALCIVFVTAWWQMTLWLMIGTAMAMDRILANEASSGRGGPFGDSAPASGGRKALRVAVLDTKRGIPLLARKRNG